MTNKKMQLSPLMRQYYEIKSQYPDMILLFQVGDFYELFCEDAKVAANFLGITLTKRGTDANGEPIALCGVPMHVLDHYLTKLVKGGFRVAICDQLEQAKAGKIVQRGVTRVLTPGTLTDLSLLDEKSASFLAVIFPTMDQCALYFVEILTGQLYFTNLTNINAKALQAELSRFMPDEIVLPNTSLGKKYYGELQKLGFFISLENFSSENFLADKLTEEKNTSASWFKDQFNQDFSIIQTNETALYGFSLLYRYLKRNNERALFGLKSLLVYQPEDFLMLDSSTIHNLELVKNSSSGSRTHSLLGVIDETVTAMGSRLLKKWLLRPLVKKDNIEQRLDAIEQLINNLSVKDQIREGLKNIGDLERIVGRITLRRAILTDYISLKESLKKVPELSQNISNNSASGLLANVNQKLGDFSTLVNLLQNSLNDDGSKDWLIKEGYDSELDRLRLLFERAEQTILELEQKEQKITGINSLKIKYNGVSGYSIEVTKANSQHVPDRYMRLQTLTNKERYTTQELRDLEHDIERATKKLGQLEKNLFDQVKLEVEKYINLLKKTAQAIAYLDSLSSLAHVAYKRNYKRPKFNDEKIINIKNGRHPVAEAILDNEFIANDTNLNNRELLWIITGPNMGGKSTYLRQVALICILAQIGSFIPAVAADLPILDRIFTRIGAGDNVAAGKSTFLVEMEETALICNQATNNSLVILDEVGRGTSTYDGLAIAQAVLEYIYTHIGAKCLFATHYHELTQLTKKFTGIVSYHAASVQDGDNIVLLHKIIPGVAKGSFGIEVAKIAQLPKTLISRAEEILTSLNKIESFSKTQKTEHSLNIEMSN